MAIDVAGIKPRQSPAQAKLFPLGRSSGVKKPRIKALPSYRPHANTADNWLALATAADLKLPRSDAKLNTGRMMDWLASIHVSKTAYLRWGGYKTLADFARLNPTWTLRSWAGLVIEHKEQM